MPVRLQKSAKFTQQPMLTCRQWSLASPVCESTNDPARPPRARLASNSETSIPRSAKRAPPPCPPVRRRRWRPWVGVGCWEARWSHNRPVAEARFNYSFSVEIPRARIDDSPGRLALGNAAPVPNKAPEGRNNPHGVPPLRGLRTLLLKPLQPGFHPGLSWVVPAGLKNTPGFPQATRSH